MTGMTGCQHVRHSLGVYVLGAIDPAERAAVDAHLAGCPGCREELAGLAALPALLGRVPFDEAERIADFDPGRQARRATAEGPGTPGDTLSPLLARIAQRRRASRWRSLAAAAAVVLLAVGAAVGAIHVSGRSSTSVVGHGERAAADNPVTHAGVVVWYAARPWGTALEAQASGIPAGTTCEFWVIGPHGQKWQAGSWTAGWQRGWFPGSTSLQAGAVHGFEITSGARVLVHAAA